MYSTAWCGYCDAARKFLTRAGIDFDEVDLSNDQKFRQKLFDLTGGWTVPQIVIDGTPIGGYSELRRLDPSRLELLADVA